jgi:hypothetical protein
LTLSEAQCANNAAWLSRSNAVSVSQRSPSALGNRFSHCRWRASIAFAETLSASPGAWALKLALLAEISRQVPDGTR